MNKKMLRAQYNINVKALAFEVAKFRTITCRGTHKSYVFVMNTVIHPDPAMLTRFQVAFMACAYDTVQVNRPGSTFERPALGFFHYTGEAELTAGYLSFLRSPQIATYCAPFTVEEDLQPALIMRTATNKTSLRISWEANHEYSS